MRRSREYRRIARRIFLTPQKAEQLFGISKKTARRWEKSGAPLHVIKYLELAFDRQLGAIHPTWKGWRIGLNGKLYGPNHFQTSVEHIKHRISD